MLKTADESILLVGTVDEIPDLTTEDSRYEHAWLVKLSADGEVIFETAFGSDDAIHHGYDILDLEDNTFALLSANTYFVSQLRVVNEAGEVTVKKVKVIADEGRSKKRVNLWEGLSVNKDHKKSN